MNILTFDIEEWFHILDNDSTKTHKEWSSYECRIYKNMDKIFHILDQVNCSATFFIVGWIAQKYPDIVKRIDSAGYQIGSHSNMHQLVYEMNYKSFDSDLRSSISILESLTGKKVNSFRAPGFSITEKNKWAFEVLIKNGIEMDCSIFPAGRAHGGFPSFKKANPSIIKYQGQKIKEFPINTFKLLGFDFIFSGGGYFRLFPYFFINYFGKNSNYVMTYFHPRDFDPDQPIIEELSSFRKFKSYFGLASTKNKLQIWLDENNFIDLESADKIIDWNKVDVIDLS